MFFSSHVCPMKTLGRSLQSSKGKRKFRISLTVCMMCFILGLEFGLFLFVHLNQLLSVIDGAADNLLSTIWISLNWYQNRLQVTDDVVWWLAFIFKHLDDLLCLCHNSLYIPDCCWTGQREFRSGGFSAPGQSLLEASPARRTHSSGRLDILACLVGF